MKKAFSLIELSIVILIIGILVAGVTASSRLISSFKLSTARNLTTSSPVASMTGIVMWVESTGIDAINVSDPDDLQKVTTWKDISPQNVTKNNLTQGTDTARPLYKTGAINDLPAIRFDGVDDYLATATLNMIDIADSNKMTIFLVINPRTSSDTTAVVFSMESVTGSNRIGFQMDSGVPRFDFPNDTTGKLIGSGSLINGAAKVLTFYKSSTTQTIFVNGASNATQANASSVASGSVPFYLGVYSSLTQFFTNADIGEVIIFNRALKNEERKSIEAYLGKKWKITVS